jgi:nitroreductase
MDLPPTRIFILSMPTSLSDARFQKPAPVDHDILDLLRHRWSPRAFSADEVGSNELRLLFEALRWAPSASNEQPWSFLVATRQQSAAFEQLLACLNAGNQAWARNAAALAIAVAWRDLASKPQPNRTSQYDLGQAVAYFTFQATALGIAVHQMAGIDLDKVRKVGAIPDGYDPVTAFAFGYPAESATLPEDIRKKDAAPRVRRPLHDFVFGSAWGQAAAWLSPSVE